VLLFRNQTLSDKELIVFSRRLGDLDWAPIQETGRRFVDRLLDELWSFIDRPEFAWEHVWRVGDLVLWDNRSTMHRRDAFDPNCRRIMHRTQVKGDARPV
jgi:alpha-ketoglutarate-dependent taurine dioxygenase